MSWRSSTWRQTSRTRPVLITTLIAIPLAVGLIAGVIVASHPGQEPGVNLSAHGAGLGRHHHGWRPGVPPSVPPNVPPDAAATGVNLNQTPAEAADSTNCTLQVPANPLSAQGLASPYILGDGCTMSNPDLQAFVEADIINRRTGRIRVYNPLVITQGTTPAARPVPPRVPAGAVVGIMFGFNGDNLLLTGTGNALRQGRCVNGLGGSLFTQVAYCNSPAFYRVANQAIARGQLRIPALATGSDGMPCPTVRDFAVVDQDQSDNVVTTYLMTRGGQTAQDSPRNAATLGGATPINNGSDNALVNKFMDPALGCTPFEFRDKTAPGGVSGSQITDELLAAADQARPIALVPLNDPMTEVNGNYSVAKTNLYRFGVDQRPVSARQPADTPASYCVHMMRIGMRRIRLDEKQFSNFASPVPDTGNNLFTFLAARLSASFQNLNCGALLNAANPVNLTLDANGVATAATFSRLVIGGDPGGAQPTAAPTGTATADPTTPPPADPTTPPADSATTPPPADPTTPPAPGPAPSGMGAAG